MINEQAKEIAQAMRNELRRLEAMDFNDLTPEDKQTYLLLLETTRQWRAA